jgi:hypothetical protein
VASTILFVSVTDYPATDGHGCDGLVVAGVIAESQPSLTTPSTDSRAQLAEPTNVDREALSLDSELTTEGGG